MKLSNEAACVVEQCQTIIGQAFEAEQASKLIDPVYALGKTKLLKDSLKRALKYVDDMDKAIRAENSIQ